MGVYGFRSHSEKNHVLFVMAVCALLRGIDLVSVWTIPPNALGKEVIGHIRSDPGGWQKTALWVKHPKTGIAILRGRSLIVYRDGEHILGSTSDWKQREQFLIKHELKKAGLY